MDSDASVLIWTQLRQWRVWAPSPSDSPSNGGVSISVEQMLTVSPDCCSQVSSTGRCCSWPGRWNCSLQERGRSCRWGRRTPRTPPAPGRPEWATPCRRRQGGYPAEWCWRLKGSGRKNIKAHAGSRSNNIVQKCPEVMHYQVEMINDSGAISKYNVTGGVKYSSTDLVRQDKQWRKNSPLNITRFAIQNCSFSAMLAAWLKGWHC